MYRKFLKYDHQKTFMFPNGKVATPEVMEKEYPACKVFDYVVETDQNGQVCFAFQNLSALRSMHDIPQDLSEEEAIAAIEKIVNTQPVVIDTPSPEERIAAALEYQNLVSME